MHEKSTTSKKKHYAVIAGSSIAALVLAASLLAWPSAMGQIHYGFIMDGPPKEIPYGITLQGNAADECKERVEEAFSHLYTTSFYHKMVVKYLDKITCVEESPYPETRPDGFVWVRDANYVVPGRVFYGSTTWLAANLVHESCHIKQYQEGVLYGGYWSEMECNQYSMGTLYAIDAPEHQMDHVSRIIMNEVNYWDRSVPSSD